MNVSKCLFPAIAFAACVAQAYNGLETIPDVRVAPLLKSAWGLQTDTGYSDGNACFNYYTPKQYPCGCSATAMAQVMRYWQYASVRADSYACKLDGVSATYNVTAGDYDWANMPLDPRGGASEAERQAIGKLTYDCAVAMHTSFGETFSFAYSAFSFFVLKNTFGYDNAMGCCSTTYLSPSDIRAALYSNLDAGCPVLMGLMTAEGGGHMVVVDGYGFSGTKEYVHLNMGWSDLDGADNRWYELPNVETRDWPFTKVNSVVYNIFPDFSGDILSGRVVDAAGAPVSNASVSATCKSGSTKSSQCTTDANGIYAFVLEGGKTYTVTCEGQSTTVKLVKSVSDECNWSNPFQPMRTGVGTLGNSWGNDFVIDGGVEPSPSPTPDPGKDDPLGAFNPAKAINGAYPYAGAVYDATGAACGTVTLKVGKASSKGVSKISGTIMLLDGKKYSVKSTPFEVNETGPAKAEDIETKKLGLMDMSVGANGFTATIDCLDGSVLTAKTADLSQGLPAGFATFAVEGLPTSFDGCNVLTNCTANGQVIAVSGKKWDCGKAASIKYKKVTVKDPETGAKSSHYELQGLDDPKKPNLSGLKLTYTAKTASFKGTFYLYTDAGTEAKPKLKKTKVSVTGFVIDGKGVGVATAKEGKSVLSWPVTVE